MQNPSLPEGPGVDTCAQPDAVGTADGSASGPQVLSWEAGLKGWSRKNATGTRVASKTANLVTGSLGHGGGGDADPDPVPRVWVTTPVSGPPLPRGPCVQVGDCKGVFVSGLEVTEVRSHWRLQRSPGGRAPKSWSPPPRGPGRAGPPSLPAPRWVVPTSRIPLPGDPTPRFHSPSLGG